MTLTLELGAPTAPTAAAAACRVCGRPLHAPASVELGIGPRCAARATRTVNAGRRKVRVLALQLPFT